MYRFQPFLRFNRIERPKHCGVFYADPFQPFLRFNARRIDQVMREVKYVVSTLLEIQPTLTELELYAQLHVSTLLEIQPSDGRSGFTTKSHLFQPFLRFNGSRVWLLWVFKFFFGFF